MLDQADVLISVRGRFVDGMLNGTKRVELRRRAPRIAAATRIWIYSKAPVAAVSAMAILSEVETLHPKELWRQHRSVLDLSLEDFQAYVAGCNEVSALCLGEVYALRPVSLKAIRQLEPSFHPPQFYMRLAKLSPLIHLFEQNLIAGQIRSSDRVGVDPVADGS